MPECVGMSCFEIAHTLDTHNVFASIDRKCKLYKIAIPLYPLYNGMNNICTQDIHC